MASNNDNQMNNVLQCYGCIEGLLFQEAHMEYGGCLFSPSACEQCKYEECRCEYMKSDYKIHKSYLRCVNIITSKMFMYITYK